MSKQEENIIIPKEITAIFLNELQIKKLNLLHMLSLNSISLKYLEDHFSFSRRKTKDFSKSFIDEINSFDMKSIKSLIEVNDVLQFNPKLKRDEHLQIIQKVRENYIETSSMYRFLIYVLENRKVTLNNITNNLVYSESYTYKLIVKINTLFELLKLNLSLNKINDHYILTGEEIIIRHLHYFSVAIVSKGTKNSVSTSNSIITDFFISYYKKRIEKLSPVGKIRIKYLTSIFSLQINNNNYLPRLEAEVMEIGNIHNIYKDKNFKKALLLNSNKQYILNELVSLDFLVFYFTQELRTDSEKVEIAKSFSKFINNSIVDTCTEILNQINSKYPMNQVTFNLLLYHLCNNLVVITHLKLHNFMHLRKNHSYGKLDTYFIEKCIDTSLKKYKTHIGYSKLKSNFLHIITSEISLTPHIYIYIEFFHQPEYKSFISSTLKKIYNNQLIQITENYVDANVIISDTTGYDLNGKEYYYFKNIFDKASWVQLGQYLNEIIINDNLS